MNSPLNTLRRGFNEDAFDEKTISNESDRIKKITKLVEDFNRSPLNEDDMLKKCINCQKTGANHMNRHFCSPECAISYYEISKDLNPYKPKGGKTKRRRTKKTKRRRTKKD